MYTEEANAAIDTLLDRCDVYLLVRQAREDPFDWTVRVTSSRLVRARDPVGISNLVIGFLPQEIGTVFVSTPEEDLECTD